jgi:hypothetical protein
VTVSGRAPSVAAAAGTYAVSETDRGIGARSLRYLARTPPAPAGIEPVTATVEATVVSALDGPRAVSSVETATGIDRGAHQAYAVNDSASVTTTWSGPVAAVEHIVENGFGTNGVSFAHIDMTRTTHPDGSFDETGSVATMNTHDRHVGRDFAVRSHDQTPGFSLVDLLITAPSGSGSGQTVSVTRSRQGRTIGDAPITTETYTIPAWFASMAAPVTAERTWTPNAPVAPACRLRAGAVGLRLHELRRRADPSTSLTETMRDTFYAPSLAAQCRIEQLSVTYYDVTTGSRIGSLVDRTVISNGRELGWLGRERPVGATTLESLRRAGALAEHADLHEGSGAGSNEEDPVSHCRAARERRRDVAHDATARLRVPCHRR